MQAAANHIHLSRATEVWHHTDKSAAAWGTKTVEQAAAVLQAYGETTVTVEFHVGHGHEKQDLKTFSRRIGKLSALSGYSFTAPAPIADSATKFRSIGTRS